MIFVVFWSTDTFMTGLHGSPSPCATPAAATCLLSAVGPMLARASILCPPLGPSWLWPAAAPHLVVARYFLRDLSLGTSLSVLPLGATQFAHLPPWSCSTLLLTGLAAWLHAADCAPQCSRLALLSPGRPRVTRAASHLRPCSFCFVPPPGAPRCTAGMRFVSARFWPPRGLGHEPTWAVFYYHRPYCAVAAPVLSLPGLGPRSTLAASAGYASLCLRLGPFAFWPPPTSRPHRFGPVWCFSSLLAAGYLLCVVWTCSCLSPSCPLPRAAAVRCP